MGFRVRHRSRPTLRRDRPSDRRRGLSARPRLSTWLLPRHSRLARIFPLRRHFIRPATWIRLIPELPRLIDSGVVARRNRRGIERAWPEPRQPERGELCRKRVQRRCERRPSRRAHRGGHRIVRRSPLSRVRRRALPRAPLRVAIKRRTLDPRRVFRRSRAEGWRSNRERGAYRLPGYVAGLGTAPNTDERRSPADRRNDAVAVGQTGELIRTVPPTPRFAADSVGERHRNRHHVRVPPRARSHIITEFRMAGSVVEPRRRLPPPAERAASGLHSPPRAASGARCAPHVRPRHTPVIVISRMGRTREPNVVVRRPRDAVRGRWASMP